MLVFWPAEGGEKRGAENWAPDSEPSIGRTEKDDPLRFASAVGFGARGQNQNQGCILADEVMLGSIDLESFDPRFVCRIGSGGTHTLRPVYRCGSRTTLDVVAGWRSSHKRTANRR